MCEGPDGLCHTELPVHDVPVGRIEAIGLGDFTGDGIVDVAIGDDLANVIVLMQGLGDGTFAELSSSR